MDVTDPTAGNGASFDPHFGEQGGKLTYGTYLRVAELL